MSDMRIKAAFETADPAECDEFCAVCHCTGEGCDGTVCHGLDAD